MTGKERIEAVIAGRKSDRIPVLVGTLAHAAWLRDVPGYLLFPIALGGSLSVVALIGVVVLREHLSVYGYLGVLSGIAATVILAIP
jgi:hypothetical protein